MLRYLFILWCFTNTIAFAQNINEPIDYSKVYNNSIDLYHQGKYEESLLELDKIDRNDSIYAEALLQKTLLYIMLEKVDESISACEEGILLNSPFGQSFKINLGVSLNMAKRPEDAIEVLDAGIKKYPKNYLFYFNKGVVFRAMGKMQEATEMYKQSLLLNPYYVNNHLNLGIIAAEEGKVSQAVMSLTTCLLLEPESNRALAILKKINDIVSFKYEREPQNVNLAPEGGDDFEELDIIITNYAALSKDFKIPVKVDLPFIKQCFALFSKLEYDRKDKGFWTQTYVPLYKEIIKQNMFSGFAYYTLQPSTNEMYVKMVKKNASSVKQFAKWLPTELDKIQRNRMASFDGKMQEVQHFYNDDHHNLELIGTYDEAKKKFFGYIEIYQRNGMLKSKGIFNANEEKEGLWSYYNHLGNLSSQSTFSKNVADGPFKVFWPDGTLKREGTYKNGKQEGVQKEYNKAGTLESVAYFKDNKFHGDYTTYYLVDEKLIHYKGKYNQGKLTDTIFQYFDNGKIASIKAVENATVPAVYNTYYRNGQLSAQARLLNDEYEGNTLRFDRLGKIIEEGTYKEGDRVGLWKTYDNGILTEENPYDAKGKKNGLIKNYDSDGKLHLELEYVNGILTSYKFFDKSGKVVKEDKNAKGEFNFSGYSPEGHKIREGKWKNESRVGLWKYFNEYGKLSSEENYNDKGELNGNSKIYFKNGRLSEEFAYKEGEKDGIYVSYYSDGKIEQEGWYRNGLRQGYWYTYQFDGSLKSKQYFINDNLSGHQQYFRACGKLDYEEYIHDDLVEKLTYYDLNGEANQIIELPKGTGKYLSKFDNNNTKTEVNYILGIAHGKAVWYHYNGKISSEGNYHNHNQDGQWAWYYEDGKLRSKGIYENDEKEGKWMSYHPNGKLKMEETFVNGSREGDKTWYYDNGSPMVKKVYKNNQEEGNAYYYEESGELQYVKIYDKGKFIAYTYNDSNGKLLPPIDVASGTFKVTAYFKNGKKSVEYSVVNGDIQGEYYEYHFNGNLLEKVQYVDGNFHGTYFSFYPDGKPRYEFNYLNDSQHGISKSYHPNGIMEKKENYIHGNLDGECEFFDKKGKLVKRVVYDDDEIVTQVNL